MIIYNAQKYQKGRDTIPAYQEGGVTQPLTEEEKWNQSYVDPRNLPNALSSAGNRIYDWVSKKWSNYQAQQKAQGEYERSQNPYSGEPINWGFGYKTHGAETTTPMTAIGNNVRVSNPEAAQHFVPRQKGLMYNKAPNFTQAYANAAGNKTFNWQGQNYAR